MAVGILTEKASAAQNFAKALGGMQGNYNGTDYVIVHASGHLFEFVDPTDMVSGSEAQETIGSWDIKHLPWDPNQFSWKRSLKGSKARSLFNNIKSTLSACDEISIATDIDPTGEGDLLAWEILDEIGVAGHKLSRMEFVDEASASIQKAFSSRRSVSSKDTEGDYRKAEYRSRFDFLSMQWTRAFSRVAGEKGYRAVLRNGRLKSAMNVIVGDGLEAYNNYKKKPFYQVRFKDNHGVMYTSKDAPKFNTQGEVPLSDYHNSTVTVDDKSPIRKYKKPPKLLDLSSLASILASKGFSAKKVQEVYQQMYEAQVVSYPRTEDKFISEEQFNELLPKVDKIAAVVGANVSLLTHRTPRPSHVKNGGAHGANRPGPNVPASLDAVESTYGTLGREIYRILGRNYVAMLAEDYVYDQYKGYITDYPDFVGIANKPVSAGWMDVFNQDDEDGGSDNIDENDNDAGLGDSAEPVCYEGANPRPPKPTMKWLMRQLEKHNVGTGATRTSTYAEMSSKNKKFKPLFVENRGAITLSNYGELNYKVIAGTKMGGLDITQQVYENMKSIAAGSLTMDDALSGVGQLVLDDIEIARKNMESMDTTKVSSDLTNATYKPVTGVWNGEEVKFNSMYRGHEFSDAEVKTLLAGDAVTFMAQGKDSQYEMKGQLAHLSFTDPKTKKTVEYVGIERVIDTSVFAVGTWCERPGERTKFKRRWSGYEFSDEEIEKLFAGEEIEIEATSQKTGNTFTVSGKLEAQEYEGYPFVGFKADFNKGRDVHTGIFTPADKDSSKYAGQEVSFAKKFTDHEFTPDEVGRLLKGEEIEVPAKSKNGKRWQAKLRLGEDFKTKRFGIVLNTEGFGKGKKK